MLRQSQQSKFEIVVNANYRLVIAIELDSVATIVLAVHALEWSKLDNAMYVPASTAVQQSFFICLLMLMLLVLYTMSLTCAQCQSAAKHHNEAPSPRSIALDAIDICTNYALSPCTFLLCMRRTFKLRTQHLWQSLYIVPRWPTAADLKRLILQVEGRSFCPV
eukprot:17618-Heterococcus_DN1.PRE.1